MRARKTPPGDVHRGWSWLLPGACCCCRLKIASKQHAQITCLILKFLSGQTSLLKSFKRFSSVVYRWISSSTGIAQENAENLHPRKLINYLRGFQRSSNQSSRSSTSTLVRFKRSYEVHIWKLRNSLNFGRKKPPVNCIEECELLNWGVLKVINRSRRSSFRRHELWLLRNSLRWVLFIRVWSKKVGVQNTSPWTLFLDSWLDRKLDERFLKQRGIIQLSGDHQDLAGWQVMPH